MPFRLEGTATRLSVVVVVALTCHLWATGGAFAQDEPENDAPTTRAAVIAAQQAAKETTPSVPHPAEAIVRKIQSTLVESPSGFYPMVGSVRSSGSFALGAGYRDYYRGNTFWDVHGMYSIRQYKRVELGTTSVSQIPGRFDFSARAGWLDATELRFFGTGISTAAADRTSYRYQQTYAGGSFNMRPHRWLVFGAEADVEHYALEEGLGRYPSIEEIFTPDAAVGLGTDSTFVRLGGTAGFDWRRSAGYTRTGGLYAATLQAWVAQDSTFSFQRLDVDLVQHIPVVRETWVLALRANVATVLDADDLVPFYLLPALGGGRSLRGYHTERFRDRHSLLTTAEWRWFPNRYAFDMALFLDAGKVTGRRRDLNFDGLRTNWGIGARFHGMAVTPLRLELAKGREGWALIFSASPPF